MEKQAGEPVAWPVGSILGFRVLAIYLLALIIPVDPAFYQRLVKIDWRNITYHDIDIVNLYFPWFANNPYDRDFSGVFVLLLISLAAAGIWDLADARRKSFKQLFKWLTVIVRYRIALAMFHFAFVKIFPLQMPFPSLSHLNTNLGDFTPGKLYWLMIGSAQSYEIFAGTVELVAGVLLFFRRTARIGAAMMLPVIIPLLAMNLLYDAGVQLKSYVLLLMTLFLIAPDFKNYLDFFFRGRRVALRASPDVLPRRGRWNLFRNVAKTAIFSVFCVFYAFKAGQAYAGGKRQMRTGVSLKEGMPALAGYYRVVSFSQNGQSLPYTVSDPVRWQNVVIESWNTLSIKSGRPVALFTGQARRGTEMFGAAGRHYYRYYGNYENRELSVVSRVDSMEKYQFRFRAEGPGRLWIEGRNQNGDELSALLEKVDREYPLLEGRVEKEYTP